MQAQSAQKIVGEALTRFDRELTIDHLVIKFDRLPGPRGQVWIWANYDGEDAIPLVISLRDWLRRMWAGIVEDACENKIAVALSLVAVGTHMPAVAIISEGAWTDCTSARLGPADGLIGDIQRRAGMDCM